MSNVYVPTMNNPTHIATALRTSVRAIAKDVEKLETSQTANVVIPVADYAAWYVNENGNPVTPDALRKWATDTLTTEQDGEKISEGRSSKGHLQNVISQAIKAGMLVQRGVFTVRWFKASGASMDIQEEGTANPGKGYRRDVFFRLPEVRPMEKRRQGKMTVDIPTPDMLVPASRKDISDAFAHFIQGNQRDSYGNPQREKAEGSDKPLVKEPLQALAMALESKDATKATDQDRAAVESLVSALSAKYGVGADVTPYDMARALVDVAKHPEGWKDNTDMVDAMMDLYVALDSAFGEDGAVDHVERNGTNG